MRIFGKSGLILQRWIMPIVKYWQHWENGNPLDSLRHFTSVVLSEIPLFNIDFLLSFKLFGHRHITDIQCVGDTYLLKNL